jgi:hypothetical protein
MATGVVLGIALAAVTCSGSSTDGESAVPPLSAGAHREAVEGWRAKHDRDYRDQYVTIAGLLPLREGSNTAGSATSNDVILPSSVPATVGRFVRTGAQVRFEPAPGANVLLRDEPVATPVDLRNDTTADVDELVIGDVRLVVHPSGTAQMLRVRDPNGPLATGFLGFTWFPIDMQYRVTGRFIADADATRVRVPNTFGDIDEYATEGVVEFTLLGETLRLRPFTTRPNRFWFVFRDASSGVETYEAARFLYADLLADGSVVLDFNMAYNPPCAFNPYTTCPIPLRENRLPVKILAGEKDYPIKVELPVNAD